MEPHHSLYCQNNTEQPIHLRIPRHKNPYKPAWEKSPQPQAKTVIRQNSLWLGWKIKRLLCVCVYVCMQGNPPRDVGRYFLLGLDNTGYRSCQSLICYETLFSRKLSGNVDCHKLHSLPLLTRRTPFLTYLFLLRSYYSPRYKKMQPNYYSSSLLFSKPYRHL